MTRPERDDNGRPGRSLRSRGGELEAAGQHRIDHDTVAVQVKEQELAPSAQGEQLLADKRELFCRCTPHGQRAWRLHERDPPAGQGRVEGFRHDGQVGKLGHSDDCSEVRAMLDSPDPATGSNGKPAHALDHRKDGQRRDYTHHYRGWRSTA